MTNNIKEDNDVADVKKEELFIDEDLILLNLEAENWKDVLNKVAKNAEEKGVVKESFTDALIEREKIFPTGLQSESLGVALPHTDAVHVNDQAISLAVLTEPVEFIHMGTDDQKVNIHILFMLAIKDPSSQLELLQKLMGVIQKEEVLREIKECKSKKKALSILQKELYEEEKK